ncbi:ribosomal protein L22e [Rozella allomycis CSF55]|uniref:Large ribosomal subunit protein eL22 n=1 Tax=Rozella allomycis (strain CSF55) TaxID=988480 RepID=A0A075AZC4_ROZAC|nr:Ribosomal protein L22e domain-containing protein [Rozella allomycis CSF55]RKP20082.1 ribosomal protein L22e [Rozella allomycis CSF55]|eukprot:EPZ33934.1 Ribosomal protein L22e domain-containing protein [Rozella allomycis CSF55]
MAPTKKNTKTTLKFTVDCSAPVKDGVFDIASYEKFLKERIKVDGRVGNLGTSVAVTKEGNKMSVSSNIAFSKRYLKYLTKKFLKKHQLRDWMRLIATDKNTYLIKYFNVEADEE